ncbi:unnamed protein product [Rodentolepis nana]|uniref:Vezatin n=1 Tax=Rodentolepis nana TaxID=102285 RepID=A0A0R3TT75_RODNA|nr:unnamed protein product [Rodentolepis nana]
MDYDTSVFPPNHPLRAYLRDLNLDDIDEFDPYDISPDDEPPKKVTKEPSFPARVYKYIMWFFCYIDLFPRKHLLDRLIKSGYILSCDRVQLQDYRKELEGRSFCQISYFTVLYSIPFLLAILFADFTSLSLLIGIFMSILLISNFLFTISNIILVKYSVIEMEILFSSLIKSVKFLRGLTGVEMGFIFAGRGCIGRKQLSATVLPKLTAKLYDAVKIYTSELLSSSQKANKIIRSCDFLSSRLAEIAIFCDAAENDLTEALSGENNLRNTKILLEAAFELNSEMTRVLGYFFTAHFRKSTIVSLKMMQLLGLWSLGIFRAKRNMASVEMMQTNLLKGQISSDESSGIVSESSASWTETSDVTKMLSALTNLHLNVLAWSIRIHKLREKVAAESKGASLPDLVAGDLESMRFLLNSCQLCLNEASALLRRESDESSSSPSHRVETLKPSSSEGPVKLIPLDSEITVEYECLEAFVGEDDNQSNGMVDEFYDEFDNLGRPLSKSEVSSTLLISIRLNIYFVYRKFEFYSGNLSLQLK